MLSERLQNPEYKFTSLVSFTMLRISRGNAKIENLKQLCYDFHWKRLISELVWQILVLVFSVQVGISGSPARCSYYCSSWLYDKNQNCSRWTSLSQWAEPNLLLCSYHWHATHTYMSFTLKYLHCNHQLVTNTWDDWYFWWKKLALDTDHRKISKTRSPSVVQWYTSSRTIWLYIRILVGLWISACKTWEKPLTTQNIRTIPNSFMPPITCFCRSMIHFCNLLCDT